MSKILPALVNGWFMNQAASIRPIERNPREPDKARDVTGRRGQGQGEVPGNNNKKKGVTFLLGE